MAERLWALVRTLIFLIFVPGTVAVFAPLLLLGPAPAGGPVLPGLGPALVALGALIWLWAGFGFSIVGRGTPSPLDAPRELVAWGPYRWVRNPMYVAVLAVISGIAIEAASLIVAVYGMMILAAFHLFVVLYEEPSLERRFGASYLEYKRAVPRWIPRPPRARAA